MKRAAIIGIQLCVAIVFLTAAYPKIMDAKSFAADILAYDLVGWSVAKGMAVWIPWLEGIAGVLILLGWWVRPAASLLGLLTVIFTIAKISALWRGLQIDCGCFGYSDPLTTADVFLDVGLLLGMAGLIRYDKLTLQLFPVRPRATQNHPQ